MPDNNNMNIDFNQLLGLLNKVDLSQLSSLIGGIQPPAKGNVENFHGLGKGNKGVQVLRAVKPLMSADRGELIDVAIQLYSISRILR